MVEAIIFLYTQDVLRESKDPKKRLHFKVTDLCLFVLRLQNVENLKYLCYSEDRNE